jgi:hypothetical protein
MSKLDWRRAQLHGRAREPINGVPNGPKDRLAYRADKAMRAWQRKLSPSDRRRVKWAT